MFCQAAAAVLCCVLHWYFFMPDETQSEGFGFAAAEQHANKRQAKAGF